MNVLGTSATSTFSNTWFKRTPSFVVHGNFAVDGSAYRRAVVFFSNPSWILTLSSDRCYAFLFKKWIGFGMKWLMYRLKQRYCWRGMMLDASVSFRSICSLSSRTRFNKPSLSFLRAMHDAWNESHLPMVGVHLSVECSWWHSFTHLEPSSP